MSNTTAITMITTTERRTREEVVVARVPSILSPIRAAGGNSEMSFRSPSSLVRMT